MVLRREQEINTMKEVVEPIRVGGDRGPHRDMISRNWGVRDGRYCS